MTLLAESQDRGRSSVPVGNHGQRLARRDLQQFPRHHDRRDVDAFLVKLGFVSPERRALADFEVIENDSCSQIHPPGMVIFCADGTPKCYILSSKNARYRTKRAPFRTVVLGQHSYPGASSPASTVESAPLNPRGQSRVEHSAPTHAGRARG